MRMTSAIHELDAPIQAPRFFVAARCCRALFTVADGRELLGAGALQLQHAAHCLRATLAEADVVLAAAALVGMAFEPDLHVRVRSEVAAVGLQHGIELGLDVGLVVVEVNYEFAQTTPSLRVERRLR